MASKFLTFCPHCAGTGEIEVTGTYRETLIAVRKLGREVTGAELGRLMGINPTAANQRLRWLADRLFLTARPFGRKVYYKPT